MSDMTDTHPYTLEISLVPGSDVLFQWAVRKHGKLLERSDRKYFSLAEAQKKGEAAIERLFAAH